MAAAFGNGTRKFFNMNTAPTGWTRDATAYDHAILITGVGNYISSTGGVSNFTTVHPSTTMSATASGSFFGSPTSESALDIPSHTHTGFSSARTSSFFGTTQTGYTFPSSNARTVPYWRFVSAQNASSFSETDWSDPWPTGSIGMGSLVVGTTYSIASLGTTTAAQWSTVSGGTLSASSTNIAVGDTFVAATNGSGLGSGQVRAQVPGGTHNHNTSVTGTFTNSGSKSFNLGVKYVDLMLASKNGIYGATWASQTSSTVVKGNFVSFTWNTPTTTIPVGSTIYYTIQNIGYTGALSSTARSGSFVTTGATFAQSITITDNSVWDNGGSFMIQIRSDSIDGTIMARSQVVTITEPNPTVTLTTANTAGNVILLSEGETKSLTFSTTRLRNGELLTYNINPVISTGVSPSAPVDFLGSIVTGQVAVNSNAVTLDVNPIIDLLIENSPTFDSFYVTLSTRSGLVLINTSQAPTSRILYIVDVPPTATFTVIPTTLSVNTAGTFTITTTNVPNGTILTWQISGGANSQGTYVNTTGTVYIYNNTGTFYITPNSVRDINKAFQVSTWTFGVIIKNSTGQTLQTSALVTVNNCTVAFVTPITSFNQGETVRYNITTTNIPNGTQLVWKIISYIGNDTCFSAVQGYVTIDNNTGSFTISATSNNTFASGAWTTHTMDIYDFAGTFKLTGSGVGVTPVTYGTGVIKVNQTYPAVTYKFITPPLSISEGTAATLEFISNTSSGTLYWTINTTTSVSNADFTGSVVSGSVVLNGSTVIDSTNLNQRYLQRFTLPSTAVDILNESNETFTVSLRKVSVTGEVVGTSEIITIMQVPVTYYFADFSTVINEGTTNTYRINTTSVVNGTILYWDIVNTIPTSLIDFSGSTSGSFTINSNTGTFTITSVADGVTEGDEKFTINVRTGSNTGTIQTSLSNITIGDTSKNPTYRFISLPVSINEGSSGSITFETTSVNPGTVFYWTINYISSTSVSDFSSVSGSFTTTGTFSVSTGTFSVSPALDSSTEGTQFFTVSVRTGSITDTNIVATSGTIEITDISLDPTFAFSNATTTINEGTSVNYTVNCTDVVVGSSLYWTVNHITTSPNDFVESYGTVVISNGSLLSSFGTFTISTLLDSVTEGSETFTLQVRTGSITGPVVATSPTITIVDISLNPTYTFSSPSLSITERNSATYTINTTDVPIGSTLFYTIDPITFPSDFVAPTLPTTYSVSFNGSSYLTPPANSIFALSDKDFTVEAWIRSSSPGAIFDTRIENIRDLGFAIYLVNNTLRFGTANADYIVGQTIISSSTWYHIAVSRSGTTFKMFLNGIQEGSTFTGNKNFTNNTVRIGYGQNGYFNGYISNLRVIKGTGLYSTNFTPTGPLFNINATQTILLMCQGPTVTSENSKANGGSSWPITAGGSPTISTQFVPSFNLGYGGAFVIDNGTLISGTGTFTITPLLDDLIEDDETFSLQIRTESINGPVVATSPTITLVNTVLNPTYTFSSPTLTISEGSVINYPILTSDVRIGTTLYYTLNHITTSNADFRIPSSSVYFDGSSYLTPPVDNAFAFGTDDFTVEAWFNSTDIATAGAIFDNRSPDIRNQGFGFFISGSKINFGTTGSNYRVGVTTLLSNTWYHVALSRYTVSAVTVTKMFLNGVQEGATVTGVPNFTNSTVRIGTGQNGFFNGYISNLRVVKGTGLYTTTFTPTGPLSRIGYTSETRLLVCQGPTVTSDNSAFNNGSPWSITAVGSPTISTSITPPFPLVSNGGSFVVDSGTLTLGSGTFTISTKTDSLTEGNETFSLQIRTDSTIGNVVATSPTITIASNTT